MRIVAYVLMVIGLLSLLAWLAVAPMSLMAFDSAPSLMAYGFVGAVLAYPVWLLGWLWSGWKQLRSGDDTRGAVHALVGAGPATLLLAILTLAPK